MRKNEKHIVRTGNIAEYDAQTRANMLIDALISDETSPEVKEKIRKWFKSNLSIDAKYDVVKGIFDSLEPNLFPDQYEYEKFDELLDYIKQKERHDRAPRITLRKKIIRIAAVLIPFIALTGLSFLWLLRGDTTMPSDNATSNTLVSVAADNREYLKLPDGSEVWLKSGSEIRYSENFEQNRVISLTGEAFFDVKNADKAPFVVETPYFSTTVLGTAFNVKAYDDERVVTVELVRGKIKVKAADKDYILLPEEQLTYMIETEEVSIQKCLPELVAQWRHDAILLNEVPLEHALNVVGGYFDVVIEINGHLSSKGTVRTVIQKSNKLEDVLYIIRYITNNFDYEITNDTVRITPR